VRRYTTSLKFTFSVLKNGDINLFITFGAYFHVIMILEIWSPKLNTNSQQMRINICRKGRKALLILPGKIRTVIMLYLKRTLQS
jgi:hypothetical protein